MGFIYCGKHPLLMARIQVSDPGPMDPLVFGNFCVFFFWGGGGGEGGGEEGVPPLVSTIL